MKKLRLPILLLLVVILLCSCAKNPPANDPCAHMDSNMDYICDACQETLQRPECITHADLDADLACDACGCFVDEIIEGWLLEGIPTYKGGILAQGLYTAGQGIDTEQLLENENQMQVVSQTTAAEFKAYLAKLNKAGYQEEFNREADTNLFASYIKENVRVYAYFMSRTGQARIIKENADISAALSDFEYTYVKNAGEQSVLYQFALKMRDDTHTKEQGYKDNGMLYLIKLADNSVVIIDGANLGQFESDDLMNMLWEITGKQSGDTVRIAGWYVTHAHTDHYRGMERFFKECNQYLQLDRVFFGLTSLNTDNEVISDGSGAAGYRKIIEIINTYCADDDPQFLRLHTGQVFSLADVTFEILHTHEDAVDSTTGETLIKNYNDVSPFVRITIDGQTFLILGDAYKVGMSKAMANWSSDYLRSDGIQLAHHVMNDLSKLYKVIRASVILVPQSQLYINSDDTYAKILDSAKAYLRDDMIFFQNEETVGIAVVNGQWEKVYSVPFVY